MGHQRANSERTLGVMEGNVRAIDELCRELRNKVAVVVVILKSGRSSPNDQSEVRKLSRVYNESAEVFSVCWRSAFEAQVGIRVGRGNGANLLT